MRAPRAPQTSIAKEAWADFAHESPFAVPEPPHREPPPDSVIVPTQTSGYVPGMAETPKSAADEWPIRKCAFCRLYDS